MKLYRIRWRSRAVVLGVMIAVGVGVLLLQRYAPNFLLSPGLHHSHDRRFWEVGADSRMKGRSKVSKVPNTPSDTKVILMNSFPSWYSLSSGPVHFSNCNLSCTIVLDPELARQVDCVVIYSDHIKAWVPPTSSRNQTYIFFASESPFNSNVDEFDKPMWRDRFNWTMTYRRDSEFYYGYGDIAKPSSPIIAQDFTPVIKNKKKLVAWFVSNCHTQSKREDYVSALKEFIPVDVYGKCGPLKCGKEGDRNCMTMLSKEYYFYLSFENSMCKDYITEKLYRTMKYVDIVPVVRGGANYSAILPPNSVIDVSAFPSVKALADHLKKVAGDVELYKKYLDWKNELSVIEPTPFPLCDMCYMVHHPSRWARVYPNVKSWWKDGVCHEPPPVVKE